MDHNATFIGFAGIFIGFIRYIEEVLHEPSAPIETRAREIYAGYYESSPGIGGGENPMADNLYQFITSVSYFEASANRINIDSLDTIVGWKMKSMEAFRKSSQLFSHFQFD